MSDGKNYVNEKFASQIGQLFRGRINQRINFRREKGINAAVEEIAALGTEDKSSDTTNVDDTADENVGEAEQQASEQSPQDC